MHSENFRRRALLALPAILVIAGTATAAFLGGARPVMTQEDVREPETVAKQGTLYSVEEAGFLYTFDAAWRTEAIFSDDDGDGVRTPVKGDDPSRLPRLRDALLRRLRVASLDSIPAEGAEELDAIRALGYI